jgi:hypothetical protein
MVRYLFACVALFVYSSDRLAAETRAAFVVGNSGYENAPRLANPARDARLVARTLESLDFEVSLYQDLNRSGFSDALGAFLRSSRDADVTLFYFAGHGMQYDGKNYLVATDAQLRSELDIDSETIALNKVVELLERNSKAALIFIDACRDNPLASDFYRRNFSQTRALETRGLARARGATDGSMLVFAAAPGQVAFDGDGLNSPFATALAKHLPTENKEVLSLTKRIIRDVRDATDGRQSPIVTNDLTTEVFLREATLRPQTTRRDVSVNLEKDLFDAAKSLRNPRAWARYFDEFPNGVFREDALAIEAKQFRSVLHQRLYDPIQNSNATVNPSAFPQEAIKRLNLSRDDTLAMQAVLSSRGYDTGGVDGAFGRRSIVALREFQQDQGFTADGIPDRPTLKALGLMPRSGRDMDRFQIANQVAMALSSSALALVEDDPRLLRLTDEFRFRPMKYGFYEDRLYAAVQIGWGADWDEVNAKAKAVGGHLTAITSKAENDFIVELIRYDESFWAPYKTEWASGPTIGLIQAEGAREPAGGWGWVTGEPRSYINWVPGFPNNNEGDSSFGEFDNDLCP